MAKLGIICAVLLVYCVGGSMAKVYTVGDSLGWRPGVNYFDWAAGKTFFVGDSLVFKYGSGDSVDEVNENDAYGCNAANAISSDDSGHTTINLRKPGYHYYICGVPDHCGNSMLLGLQVEEAAAEAKATAMPPITPCSGASIDSSQPSLLPTPNNT